VEDVFETETAPPDGWMHAIFDGGPYTDDVGRCVPGPPPARMLTTTINGRSCSYHLLTVGSWSEPNDPVAIYIAGRRRFIARRVRQFLERGGILRP
jgi:hypothetical protein